MAIRPNVSDIGISDHFCISISFGNRHKRSDEKKQIRIKHWHFSLDILEQARNNPIILDERKDSKDIQSVAKELTSWFQYFNALATTSRTVKVNNSDVPKWYTSDLKHMKEQYLIERKSGDKNYTKTRNNYVKAIRRAKKHFVRKLASKSEAGVWKVLKSKNPTDWDSVMHGASFSNRTDLAEGFANHFRDKVINLQSTPNPSAIFDSLRQKLSGVPTWDIVPCTREEVLKAIDNLKPSNSSGPDQISNRLIKELKFEAIDAITYIFNRSIKEGIFPNIWKSSKVQPIYKKGNRNEIKNYRPVCLFSNLGKLLEAVIQNQITPHLEKCLPDNIFGYRPGRGTQDAVCYLLDKIHYYRAKGYYVAAIALDASSAFDILDHSVILESLSICGAGNRFLEWSNSFLKGCSNFVDLDGVSSNSWSSDTGSGQGRRLSPIYCNVGTMSPAVLSKNAEFAGYADDEMNIVYGLTIKECNDKITAIVHERIAWYKQIGLALNLSKTEIIGFGFTPDNISFDGFTVTPSSSITYLGVCIQSNLSWEKHINSLCNKIRYAASKIRVEGRHFGITDKRKLFSGWILGNVYSNGLAFLSSATQTELNNIQVAMNAGVRAIFGLPRYGHVEISALRSKFKIPSINSIRSRIMSFESWKRFSAREQETNAPGPMTRGKTNRKFPLPDQKGHHGKIIDNALVGFWNALPLEIKNVGNAVNAKLSIKNLFSS